MRQVRGMHPERLFNDPTLGGSFYGSMDSSRNLQPVVDIIYQPSDPRKSSKSIVWLQRDWLDF